MGTAEVGSTRYLSESTGLLMPSALRYDAYGQRTALAGPNYPTPYQFAGGWGYEAEYSDASEPYLGLEYVDQRYYEPATGRFISPDPIGFAGGLNLFAYCGNDPVNCVDPFGLYWRERLSLVGGILGGLGGATEFGVGAIPGAALGAGLGAYLGSRLDGEGIGKSALNGGCDGALTYLGGQAGEIVLGRLGPFLSKIPRPALRLRRGSISLPIKGITEVEIPSGRFPQAAAHIEEAQAAGQPAELTVDRAGAAARRRASLRGHAAQSGLDRDEYPPAMFSEGGQGASVKPIEPSDNRGAGGFLGGLLRHVPNGSKVRIKVR